MHVAVHCALAALARVLLEQACCEQQKQDSHYIQPLITFWHSTRQLETRERGGYTTCEHCTCKNVDTSNLNCKRQILGPRITAR
jgi:hypothetical protein